jgi:serine/threonine protein kinase
MACMGHALLAPPARDAPAAGRRCPLLLQAEALQGKFCASLVTLVKELAETSRLPCRLLDSQRPSPVRTECARPNDDGAPSTAVGRVAMAIAEDSGIVVGRGAHSVVVKVRRADGVYVAVKQLSLPSAVRHRTGAGACLTLHHVNVVRHLSQGHGQIVMEFCDGGSLDEVIRSSGPLSEERAARVVVHTLRGLAFLHSYGVIHRDVKPANILRDTQTDTFKLCDWIEDEEAGMHGVLGTPVFLAPEVVRTGRHVFASDTWALGATVVNVLSGKLPWDKEDNKFAAMFKTAHGNAPPYDDSNMSEPFQQFLAACFEPDAALRATPSVLLDHPSSKQHPWETCQDQQRG